MTRDEEDRRVRLGAAAQRLVDDPTIQEVFDDIYQRLHTVFDNMPVNKPEDAMDTVGQLRSLKALKARLQGYVDDGKLVLKERKNRDEREQQARTGSPRI